MQPLIVVEAREPFTRVGLVEIPRNDHRIAMSLGGSFACRGRDEGNLLSIWRPRDFLSRSRQRGIGTRHGRQEVRVAAVGMRDPKAVLIGISTLECYPVAVARPHRAAGGLVAA